MRLGGDDDLFDWLVIGMAKWQLGEREVARRLLAKSQDWMNKHRAEFSEKRQVLADLDSLLRDATELIGENDAK